MSLKNHNLTPYHPEVEKALANPPLLGLTEDDFIDMNENQRRYKIIGEYYYKIWKELGYEAGNLFMMANWGGAVKPNWFDHRLHMLQPDNYIDYWTISSDLALRALPYQGKMLSLCSGDGFYESMFYGKRASEVIAIDVNKMGIANAKRLYNNNPNIKYIEGDIFTTPVSENYFDVVSIRGAIEHFTYDNQIKIFELAKKALKDGGYFVGDTPANTEPEKMHTDHENEWKDEAEMRQILEKVFTEVETFTYTSKDRTTLLWKCKK